MLDPWERDQTLLSSQGLEPSSPPSGFTQNCNRPQEQGQQKGDGGKGSWPQELSIENKDPITLFPDNK